VDRRRPRFAHKVHEKYGADVAAYDQPGDRRVVVTIEPTRIRPVDMSGYGRVLRGRTRVCRFAASAPPAGARPC
jgi:hypothetical protein